MRTTSVFTAPFEFVVWTVSYLSARPYSLYTFLDFSRLGSGLPRFSRGFPEFERFYQGTERTYPKATHLFITMLHWEVRFKTVKSAALTNMS